MTKMVSLDTSTSISGWAYWENGILKAHGVIDLKNIKSSDERVNLMCYSLVTLLKEHDPDIVVIEMTMVTTNAKTQRILSEIVGVIRGWCISQESPRFFYRIQPSEWRKLVCSEGEKPPRSKKAGLKEWDILKTKEYFGFDPVTDDEADAVLIGWAYCKLFETE